MCTDQPQASFKELNRWQLPLLEITALHQDTLRFRHSPQWHRRINESESTNFLGQDGGPDQGRLLLCSHRGVKALISEENMASIYQYCFCHLQRGKRGQLWPLSLLHSCARRCFVVGARREKLTGAESKSFLYTVLRFACPPQRPTH